MTRHNVSELSLQELRQSVREVFRRGGGSRPAVFLVGVNQDLAVLKDHGACDPWFARVLGPLLAGREARALERLRGIRGVPVLLGRPDSRSLLIEYLRARSLEDSSENTDWQAFFDRMAGLLTAMHSRGIAHCDLRSPYNTLVGAGGEPFIVDFVASVSKGRAWNIPGNWVFRQFARADREAMVKLKKSVAPQLLSEHEEATYSKCSGIERVARWIGSSVRNLSRKIFTR